MKRDHAQRVLFEQLRRTVPISAILARYNIELKRSGTSLKGCCPIHNGSNPNQFHVDENKGLWKCFSPQCGRGGDMLGLVAALENVEIREAALLVAEWFHIKPGGEVQHRDQQRSKAMSGGRPSHKHIQIASGVAVSGRLVLREYTEEDVEQDTKSKRKK